MATDPRPSSRSDLGRLGERAAARHLERLGYRVVGAGFRARRGEIDLVCRRGDALVMVEVKTRSSDSHGHPVEAVGARKWRSLTAAAAEYRALSSWRGPIEFAIVALHVDKVGNVVDLELITDPF